MIASIIAICAALIPLIVILVRRHIAKKDDPNEQNTRRKEAIAKEILVRNPERINLDVRADLDRLSALRRDKRGQGSSPSDGRTIV